MRRKQGSLDTGEEGVEDDALMRALARGSGQALKGLIERHQRGLFTFLYSRTGDRQAAEDLFQETFLRIYQARSRYRAERGFARYLYTVAINLCRDWYRSRGRKKEDLERAAYDGQAPREFASERERPDEALEQARKEDRVRGLLLSLPERERAVLVLSRFQRMPYAEIAKVLKTSEGMIKQHAFRALKRLKELMEREGAADDGN